MSEAIIRKTNQSVLYRVVLKALMQVVALVLGIVLARILSPAEFGVVAIANLIVFYANSFTNFGLNNALVQQDDIDFNHINSVFTVDLIISLMLALLTFVASDSISRFFNNLSVAAVLRWMSLYFLMTTFYHIPVVILRRDIDFRLLSIVEFVEGLFKSLVAIGLALAGFSYWSIVVASLAVPAGVTAFLMLKVRWWPRLMLASKMGEIYRFGFWSFIRSQAHLIVSKVDYFVIGRYLGAANLGVYEKSFELTERTMTGLSTPINAIFFSTFSRLKNNSNEFRQVFLEASGLLALITYPAIFGLVGVAPHFVLSALGPAWAHAVVPIQILSLACIFRVQLGMVASAIVASGKYKTLTVLDIVNAVIFVMLCFTFVSFGIVAVSLAYFSLCLLSFICSFWLIYRYENIGVVVYAKAICCPLIGAFLMLAVVVTMHKLLLTDTSSFLQLLTLIGTGVFVYCSWVFVFYRLGVIRFTIKGLGTSV